MPGLWNKIVQIYTAINTVITRMDNGMKPGTVLRPNGSAGHAETAVIDASNAKYCRMVCGTANIYYQIGTAPVATDNTVTVDSSYLPAGTIEKILVPAGQKISVLGGIVNITIMS